MRKYTYEDVKEYIENTGYKIITDHYINARTKMQVECPKGHQYGIEWYRFRAEGKRCAKCFGNIKYTLEEVRVIAKSFGFKILSNKYESITTSLDVECNKGHFTRKTITSMLALRGCTTCFHPKKREQECRNIFQQLTSKEFVTVRPSFMRNPETGFPLELDGYCEELKMAFEYDGKCTIYLYLER